MGKLEPTQRHFVARITVYTLVPREQAPARVHGIINDALSPEFGYWGPVTVDVQTARPTVTREGELADLPPGDYTVTGEAAAKLRGREIHRVIAFYAGHRRLRQRLALRLAPWLGPDTARMAEKKTLHHKLYGGGDAER